jgi:hypothetical protein
MNRIRLIVVLSLVLTALFASGVHRAAAGTFSASGVLDSSDPTLPQVALISTPNCTGGYTAFAVQYEAIQFTVTVAGTYALSETASPSTAFYLYQGSFNPAAAAAGCLAASNTNPLNISYPLAANTVYIVVIINDTFSQAPTNYLLTISGPGEISVLGGCDSMISIPSTAVGATFVADAPVYWAPGKLVEPPVTLVAGKSVRAIGLDSTGQYYQILFACQFLWVPANTLGPNYDEVWNGAPLPTGVVN